MKTNITIGFSREEREDPIMIRIDNTIWTLTLEQAENVSKLLADAIISYAGIDIHNLTKQ